MKTDTIGRLQLSINKQVNMVLMIVDDAEWRNRTGTQTQVLLHPMGRCKGDFSLLQSLFKVSDIQLPAVIQDHQVVLVALMVSEEKILAMCCINIFPVRKGLFNGRNRGVLINFVGYMLFIQVLDYGCSFTHYFYTVLSDHI